MAALAGFGPGKERSTHESQWNEFRFFYGRPPAMEKIKTSHMGTV